ncbi:MAG: dephospho-CoA kinase [bacterium]
MKAVGLTGGIGTGKSTVAHMFADLGATVIDADSIARLYLAKGMKGYEQVINRYGKEILDDNLEIDRQKVADIVFKNTDERKWLEQLVHPYVFDKIKEEINLKKNRDGIIIVDIPLLFETGTDNWLRPVIVVSCAKNVQVRRLKARTPGMTDERILERIHAQMPMEEKIKRADFVIDNSFSLEHTKEQVEHIWNILTSKN